MPNPSIDRAVAKARVMLEEKFYPDTFSLLRDIVAVDTAGGTTTTRETVASGVCKLREAGSGGERTTADRLGWTTGYAVDLPIDVPVTPHDTIIVNGRTMEIGAVIAAGNWAVKKVVIVQEQG